MSKEHFLNLCSYYFAFASLASGYMAIMSIFSGDFAGFATYLIYFIPMILFTINYFKLVKLNPYNKKTLLYSAWALLVLIPLEVLSNIFLSSFENIIPSVILAVSFFYIYRNYREITKKQVLNH